MLKTYKGSCHCGAVTFEAEIDLSAGTGRCNCSICMKTRNWNALVKPEAFRLLSGADALSVYTFGAEAGRHQFCKTCGVHPFSSGYLEVLGGAFVTVRLNCLDGVTDEELAAAPIHFANGRDNLWWEQPKVTSHL